MRAHEADADVILAMRITFAYIRRALDIPLPGKVDSCFSSASGRHQTDWNSSKSKRPKGLQRLRKLKVVGPYNDTNNKDQEGEDVVGYNGWDVE